MTIASKINMHNLFYRDALVNHLEIALLSMLTLLTVNVIVTVVTELTSEEPEFENRGC